MSIPKLHMNIGTWFRVDTYFKSSNTLAQISLCENTWSPHHKPDQSVCFQFMDTQMYN